MHREERTLMFRSPERCFKMADRDVYTIGEKIYDENHRENLSHSQKILDTVSSAPFIFNDLIYTFLSLYIYIYILRKVLVSPGELSNIKCDAAFLVVQFRLVRLVFQKIIKWLTELNLKPQTGSKRSVEIQNIFNTLTLHLFM